MTEELNPYAPPEAADEPPRSQSAPATQYYAASVLKVVLLSLATVGIYDVYWFYKQWKAVRAQTGRDLSPFWRAVFSIFFVNQLFGHIRSDTMGAGIRTTGSTGTLIAVYIISVVAGRIASRMESNVVWLVGFMAIVPIAIVQGEINQYLARVDPKHDRNAGFGAGAIVLMIVGVILWGLVILGSVMPEP